MVEDKGRACASQQARLGEICTILAGVIGEYRPQPCHWLSDDASESFCEDHVIERYAETHPKPAGWDKAWYDRTPEEYDLCDKWSEGFEGNMWGCPGESDNSEACTVCGVQLDYNLTDYGQASELDHFAADDLEIGTLTPEIAYEADKALWNAQYSEDPALLALALKAGERVLTGLVSVVPTNISNTQGDTRS